jgi:hypothetical protein
MHGTHYAIAAAPFEVVDATIADQAARSAKVPRSVQRGPHSRDLGVQPCERGNALLHLRVTHHALLTRKPEPHSS